MNQRHPQSRHTPHGGSEKPTQRKVPACKRAEGGRGQWLPVATAEHVCPLSCFTLVPSVFYTPVTRRTALYYIPRGGRRAEPPPWLTSVRSFHLDRGADGRAPRDALETDSFASHQREAHACYSEARSSGRYTLTRRPGSHCSLATLQRDQRRQLLPDGTPCLLRPKGSVLHQVFFR